MTSDDETPKKNLNPLEGLELDDDGLSDASPEDLEDIDAIDDIIDASPLGSELDQEEFSDDGENDFAAELSAMPDAGHGGGDDDMPSFDSDEENEFPAKKSGGMKKMLAPALVLVIAAGAAGYIMMNPAVISGIAGGGSSADTPVAASFDAQAAKRKAENEALAKAQAAAAREEAEARAAEQKAAKDKTLAEALPQPTANMNTGAQVASADIATMEPDEAIDDMLSAGQEMKEVAGKGDVKTPDEMPAFSNDLPEDLSVDAPDMKADKVSEVKDETLPRPPMDELVAATPAKEVKVARADTEPQKDAVQVADVDTSPKAGKDDAENNIFEEDFQSISGADSGRKSTAIPAKKPSQATDAGDAANGEEAYYDSNITVPGSQVSGIRKLDPRIEPATKFVVATTDAKKDDQESLVVAANRALKLRRYDAARDMFESLYAKNKRDKRILMGLAVAQQNTGRTESAIRTYEELLELDENNADAMVNMLGLIRAQYPSVALRRLLDLQDKYPGKAGIAAQIGVTQADMGQYDEAVRYLTRAATLDPQNAQHLFNLAIVSERQSKVKQAIAYYEQALEVDTVYGGAKTLPRDTIYDRLATLRRR